jgi:small subunit ribosomal protein S17
MKNNLELVGKVVSDKGDKTIIVAIESRIKHPLYGKLVKRTKKYAAHDEKNEAKMGDVVRITPTRPLSKTKRYALVSVEEKSID